MNLTLLKKFESFLSFAMLLVLLNGYTRSSNLIYHTPAIIYISIGNTIVVEGNSGERTIEVMVILSEPAKTPVNVSYSTKSGNAVGTDYMPSSGTITFNPGERVKKISVVITSDQGCEKDETIEIALSNPVGASLSNNTGTVTILDDDCPNINISAGSNSAKESVYEIRLTYTGFISDPGTLDNCTIRPDGKVVLTGFVSGYEQVNADDDIMYRGNLQLDVDIDICAIKRVGGVEDKFCGMTVFGSGQVDVELEVQSDARGSYIKMEKETGNFLKLVFGSCDAGEMKEQENMVPVNSIATVFNGNDLPELTNRTLTIGRYVMHSDDGETVVEVLRKIK